MRAPPGWLLRTADAFAALPADQQQVLLAHLADDLQARISRLRNRIEPADLPAFDAAAAGLTARARELGALLAPGAVPRAAEALTHLALDNRGIPDLERIALQSARAAARKIGIVLG